MWDSLIIAISEAGYFRLWMCPFVRVIDILSRTFTIGIRNNRTDFFQSRDNEFSVPYLDFLTENLSLANERRRLWMWSNMKESECYDFRRLRLPIVDLPVCESHRFFIGDFHNRNTQQSRTYRRAVLTCFTFPPTLRSSETHFFRDKIEKVFYQRIEHHRSFSRQRSYFFLFYLIDFLIKFQR